MDLKPSIEDLIFKQTENSTLAKIGSLKVTIKKDEINIYIYDNDVPFSSVEVLNIVHRLKEGLVNYTEVLFNWDNDMGLLYVKFISKEKQNG